MVPEVIHIRYIGVIIHHSICPSINGKGYDYFVTQDGVIIPAPVKTDPQYIHICVEGDFNVRPSQLNHIIKEQLFIVKKLICELADRHDFDNEAIFYHQTSCPGRYFPWSELVISLKDGYH